MLSQNQVLHQGRYRIIHAFGNPDSTSLYEAYDTVSETKVVLRERCGSLSSNVTPGQMETLKITFAEQAQRLADIKHDALLGVRDFFSETGRQYLVLESFEGQGLSELIGIDSTPAISDVVKWADQLLDALEFLHARTPAIIHQNLNPQNIRLTSEFKIKLLLTTADSEISNDQPEETEGLANYKALEQLWLGLDYASQKVIANSLDEKSEEILRQPADARTDLYGLAATVYHLVTGVTPADPLARIIDILDGNNDPLEAPHLINSEVPKGISEVLMNALAIKREDRFPSAMDMRNALKAMSSVIAATKKETLQSKISKSDNSTQQQETATKIMDPAVSKKPVEAATRPAAKSAANVAEKAAPQAKTYKPASNISANTSTVSPLDELKLELAGDDLLDLPDDGPVVTALPAPPATNVLSLESRPIAAESDFGSSLNIAEKKGGLLANPLIIVSAAAALLIVAIGGWLILGSSSNQQVTPAASVTSQAPTSTSALQEAPVVNTSTINETVTVSAESSKPEADKKTDAERKAEADKKAKKAAADAKPTPENKKKVTVDDLINDN